MSFSHTMYESLISAVKEGNIDLVQRLLESNERLLFSEDWVNYTLLVTALQKDHKNIVHLLLRLGCQVDRIPNNNITHTPLYYAVGLNDVEIVKELLERGASIYSKKDDSETPLCIAMKNKQIEIVDLILSRYNFSQIDPNNSDDIAHFLIACERDQPTVIENFIKQGISVNSSVNLNCSRFPGYTPLHFAVKNLCLETVEFLLSHGANCNIKDFNGWTALHLANQIRDKMMLKDMHNPSPVDPIIDAILFSQTTNFDLIEDNSREISFFHIACTRDNTNIVDRFLQCGVNINRCVPFESNTYSGFTALHFAVVNNCTKVIEFLIDCGAEMNAKIKEGLTPLHLAVFYGQLEIVRMLLERGANVNIKNGQDETALHYAFYDKQVKTEIVDCLLHFTPKNCNPSDKKGLSHFHIACTRSNTSIVESFIKNNVLINAQVEMEDVNYPGYAAIHFAVEYIQADVVLCLLHYRADVNLKNGNGLTALHLACKQNYVKRINVKLYELDIRIRSYTEIYLRKEYMKIHEVVEEWKKWCKDQIKIVSYLINFGADINMRDSALKATPLYYAYSLEFNKRRRITDGPIGVTSIITAMSVEKILFDMLSHNQKQTVKLLINHGADVDAKELTLGRTPLHNAVIMSNQVCLQNQNTFDSLLEANCNINARDFHGNTALHLAALNLNFPAVSELLKYGADINVETNSGETVLCAMNNSDSYNCESFKLFNLHIKKLVALGYCISNKVKRSYKKLCIRYEKERYDNSNSDEEYNSVRGDFNFEEREDIVFLKCKSELEHLKTYKLNPYCSLYNILYKSADEMTLYLYNHSLTSILNSRDFNRNYPLFGYLLQLQYRRGTFRSNLLHPGKQSLQKIIGMSLPDACLETILKYLDNDNLQNLIKSTEATASKRKLNDNSLDEFGPSLVKQLRLEQ